jgi:drug/metabolite transporter (DMT)-like permease
MGWILLATAGQFINAIVAILDKYIVSDEKVLPRPFVYAFYSCLVTGFWAVIFLFGYIPGLGALGVPSMSNVQPPTIQVVSMSFLAAYTFFMALVSMYAALKDADASDVMPAIGAIAAISSFGMAYAFLGIALTVHFMWGVLLLSVGTYLLSKIRFTRTIILQILHSGVFFALHYIAMKGLFMETNFDDGFFWSRISFVLFALSLLLVPSYYAKITQQTKNTSKKTGFLVLFTKILAGIAAFMLLKATDWGDVTVVQALDGLKFVFIIIIGFLFGKFIPHTAGENDFDFETIIRKALYIAIISVGFVILFM